MISLTEDSHPPSHRRGPAAVENWQRVSKKVNIADIALYCFLLRGSIFFLAMVLLSRAKTAGGPRFESRWHHQYGGCPILRVLFAKDGRRCCRHYNAANPARKEFLATRPTLVDEGMLVFDQLCVPTVCVSVAERFAEKSKLGHPPTQLTRCCRLFRRWRRRSRPSARR